MKAIHFNAIDHRAAVDGWCKERDMCVFPDAWLPRTGFIVEGVLAGWLYKTDSGLAYLENIISNPATTREERSQALDLVTAATIAEAKRCGFKYLLGFSAIPTVIETARRFGMSPSKAAYYTLVKRLEIES